MNYFKFPGYILPEPWQEVCDPSTNYIYYWNTLTNEVSWELPQVFEPTQAPTSTIEEIQQSNLSQKEVDDQNLTEDHSSLNDEKTITESKDVSKQAAESVVITSCVADEPEEFPIQEPGKLPPTSETCISEQAVKDTTSSSCDNLVSEHSDEKKQELGLATSSEECRKPESSRKRERSAAIDMFDSESRPDDSDESDSEGK